MFILENGVGKCNVCFDKKVDEVILKIKKDMCTTLLILRVQGSTKETGPSMMSLTEIEDDIRATEQTLSALAAQNTDDREKTQGAAISLMALLRLKAQTDGVSRTCPQLISDSCTSILIPKQVGGCLTSQTYQAGRQYSQQQSAQLDRQMQECCAALEPVTGSATLSELGTVLEMLYAKQLQMLLGQLRTPAAEAQLPKAAAQMQPGCESVGAAVEVDRYGRAAVAAGSAPIPTASMLRRRDTSVADREAALKDQLLQVHFLSSFTCCCHAVMYRCPLNTTL